MFKLGQTVMTRGIADIVEKDESFSVFLRNSFNRYKNCDWGEMCEEDIDANNYALNHGGRLFASYDIPEEIIVDNRLSDVKVWIITEWDRSVTTVLLPSEY